ncbi:MAG TPA: hypothetical protein VIN67_02735 [Desulfobaccales bacterium]
MKKILVFLALLPFFLMEGEAQAWVSVPDAGDTGWQTYVYQAGEAGFTGTAGFVVSNVLDDAGYSNLLLDNLSQSGDPANCAFEMGDYSGYTLLGGSYARVTGWAVAYSGKVYHPTQGKYFSNQACVETGVNTAGFQNANRQAGTIGSILETSISLPAGGKFTFDWAFLAGDQSPYNDFALFYLKDAQGQRIFPDGLVQIGPVSPPPTPPAITVILGSGLLSLLRGRDAPSWPANLGRPGRVWATCALRPPRG